jgi:hypothetical protein
MSFRILIRIRFRIQGFDGAQNYEGKKYFFKNQNCNLLIPRASIKDVQATGEAVSPQ